MAANDPGLFGDLIDVPNLQRMLEGQFAMSGLPCAVLGASDGQVYAAAGWQRICTEYHRRHPESLLLCRQSDTHFAGALRRGEHMSYVCRNGLRDIGVPVYCVDQHVATLFFGQFFYADEQLDRARFARQAERFGFDVDDYLAALDEVPCIGREAVEAALSYYKGFAEVLTNIVTNAELLRRRSEEDVQALLDASSESAFLMSPDAEFLAVNKTTAARVGRSPEEIIGRCAYDFLPPDVNELRRRMLLQAVETRSPLCFEDDRNGVIYQHTVHPVIDPDGEVTRVAIFARDVTETHRTLNLLRESEERFRLLAENSRDLVYRYELQPEPRFSYVSPSATAITGYSPEDHYADPHLGTKLVHPDDRALLAASVAGGTPEDDPLVLRWFHRDGEVIWTEQLLHRIYDDAGRLVALEGRARDITGRTREAIRLDNLNRLNQDLLVAADLSVKLNRLAEGIVEIFEADFARVWLLENDEGPSTERPSEPHLRLRASAGRYTHLDGPHSRLKLNSHLVGRVAQGEFDSYVTNDVQSEHPSVDQAWATELGLRSFGAFRLLSEDGEIVGVLAVFSKGAIDTFAAGHLEALANTASHIVLAARHETALHEAILRQNEAVRAADIGLWEWDLRSNAVRYSAVWKRQVGYEPHEIRDDFEEWRTRVHPADLPRVQAQIERCVADALPGFVTEFRFRHRDGHFLPILARASVVTDAAGTPIRLFGSHLNMTARKRIEEQQRRQAQVLEQIHDAVIAADLTGVITSWNRGSRNLLGYEADEMLGRNVERVYPPEGRRELRETILPQLLARGSHERETTLLRKDGTRFEALTSLSVLRDDRGQINGLITYAIDISDRKRAEREVQKYAATQSVLLREVNHRVKNNLAAIVGMLHQERRRVRALDGASYEDALDDLTSRVEGLATVHSMLSASGWRPLLLSALCEQVALGTVRSRRHEGTARVTVRPSDVTVPSGQAHHLALVVNELVTNSLKHAAGETKPLSITIAPARTGQNLRVEYRDDGGGYPPEVLAGARGEAHIGLELVAGIVEHSLRGRVHFDNDGADAVAAITFESERLPPRGEG